LGLNQLPWESSHLTGSQGCGSSCGEAPILATPTLVTTMTNWSGEGRPPSYSIHCRIWWSSGPLELKKTLKHIFSFGKPSTTMFHALATRSFHSSPQIFVGPEFPDQGSKWSKQPLYPHMFFNYMPIETLVSPINGNMLLSRVGTLRGSLCPALSQGNTFFCSS
jgi:hypothetical protein